LERGHIAFECPTKSIVIFNGNREYTSKSSTSEENKDEAIEMEVI